MATGKLTPLLRQYLDIKNKYKDCLIFFRLGDFYELFFEDAELSSKILGITLTKRGQVEGKDIPMCGVPFHQGESYLSKLLKAGHKVAICEQTETPEESKKRGHKAIIERKVVRIASPGTLTEEIELGGKENNYLMSFVAYEKKFSVAWVDISTGEINSKYCNDFKELSEVYLNISPSEVVISDLFFEKKFIDKFSNSVPLTFFDLKNKDFEKLKVFLREFYKGNEDFIEDKFSKSEIISLGIILNYISYTQNGKLPHLKSPHLINKEMFLDIDNASKRNLEIIRTLTGDKEGSLLNSVDYTLTSAGKRKLLNDLENPLYSLDKINNRLNLVDFFFQNYNLINFNLQEKLKKIPDIARSANRLFLKRGGPRDLFSIMQGLQQFNDLVNEIINKSEKKDLIKSINFLVEETHNNKSLFDAVGFLRKALKDNIPLQNKEGNFIREGFDTELDNIRKIRENSKSLILDIEQKEKKLTGIAGLKIKYNNFLGYFIDLSNVNHKFLKNNDQRYIHRQTLKNSFRYTTTELIEISEKILDSNFLFIKKENEIYNNLVSKIENNASSILKVSDIVARIDVAQSWANYAKKYNAVRPVLSNNRDFSVIEGRHPSVEKSHTEKFISNSCILTEKENKFFKLITGPNMSGKSTYLRQNAIILIMAQSGGFCPAKNVSIGICDKLFCRVGSGDELAKGNSTFMVEMLETANILNSASSKSLVILDEIGRGTSTFDGISIAWATSEYLLKNIKSKVLFATHYNELSNLAKKFEGLDLNTFRVKEWKGELIFLYEIIDGLAESSYGIQVGKMAGLPLEVTSQAFNILAKLEQNDYDFLNASDQLKLSFNEKKSVNGNANTNKILKEIKSINLDETSPLEALQKLSDIQKTLKMDEQ